MVETAQHIILLEKEHDVSVTTQAIRETCISNRFDKVDTEQMVLACSEIAHNAIRHGKGGRAEIFELNSGKMIRVIISDSGPGIQNIELASREGYTTVKTSLGLGLIGAQRLVDNFTIKSVIEQGTTVVLEKYRPLHKDTVDYGLVSIPDNNYNYNGDQYVLKEYDGDSILMGVIDGPGQGYDAHSIAQTCKQFVENNYRKPLPELLTALNTLMKESNDEVGITCSLARITPGKFSYLGLGDTHAYLFIDDKPIQHLTNQQGRIGYVRNVKTNKTEHSFNAKLTVIICSDGIKSMSEPFPESIYAQDFANVLFDQYQRPNGDATVIIAKYKI